MNQRGFTIAELVVATTLSVVVAGMILAVTLFLYGDVVRDDVESKMVVNSQNILRTTVEDLRTSSGILQTNNISDANEPAEGWVTSNDDLVLIVAEPATDVDNNFIVNTETGYPYTNELIYYAQDDVLYKRILANPNATGNTSRTTCPAAIASEACPADRVLSEDFESMEFEFYDQDDVVTTNTDLARSVKIFISLQRDAFGKGIEVSNSIRVTLRNEFI